MDLTYHIVPKKYYESLDANADYVPEPFARDGFIHCTDDRDEMAYVATLHYKAEPPPHVYLYIDKARVRAPIRYEDPGNKYPHIYGALNRDAIIAVREARRDAEGNFLAPEVLKNG